jgi:hypothetical protein
MLSGTSEALSLHLYSNNYAPVETSLANDFVQVAGGGYSARDLSNWAITGGDPSVASHSTIAWTFTSAVGNVYGYYIRGNNSGTVYAAERFSDGPYNITTDGQRIEVTLSISLKDLLDS